MSTPGHSSEGSIVNRSFPTLKNRNVVRGASVIFASAMAVGFALAPAPAMGFSSRIVGQPAIQKPVPLQATPEAELPKSHEAPHPAAPAPVAAPPAAVKQPEAAVKPAISGGVPAGYKLVWSDEFDSWNGANWEKYEGNGNAGTGKRVASAVNVQGGELQITGHGMDGGGVGSSYTGTYGYYEIRAKFDPSSIGYNTAALLWPKSDNWPVDGEIDIAEMFNGNTSECGSYLHWGASNSQLYNEYKGDFSQWHTWGVDWQADHITYYLDGKEFWHVTQANAIPHNPHFIGLQLDVTSGAEKNDGSTYHVDFVRVYQKG